MLYINSGKNQLVYAIAIALAATLLLRATGFTSTPVHSLYQNSSSGVDVRGGQEIASKSLTALTPFSVPLTQPTPAYRLHGLNFSPYIDGQDPNTVPPAQISEQQLQARMQIARGFSSIALLQKAIASCLLCLSELL